MIGVANIIPVLLNILNSEQQSQKQAGRQGQTQPSPPQYQSAPAAATATSTAATGMANLAKTSANPGQESALLPLPLKTSLFPNTQFYTYNQQLPVDDQNKQADREKGTNIAFSLGTAQLGRLFFTLNQKHDTLRIDCYAEKPYMVAQLHSQTSQLEENISAIGYSKVVFKCHLLDKQHDPDQPSFSYTGLVDLKV